MSLGVAIRKREIRSVIMIGSGQVSPLIILEAIHKKAVIDRVGMLV